MNTRYGEGVYVDYPEGGDSSGDSALAESVRRSTGARHGNNPASYVWGLRCTCQSNGESLSAC